MFIFPTCHRWVAHLTYLRLLVISRVPISRPVARIARILSHIARTPSHIVAFPYPPASQHSGLVSNDQSGKGGFRVSHVVRRRTPPQILGKITREIYIFLVAFEFAYIIFRHQTKKKKRHQTKKKERHHVTRRQTKKKERDQTKNTLTSPFIPVQPR